MSQQSNDLYEFEGFRLDLAEKTLTRHGEVVSVTPKVFETLQLFLENAGHLVEKDELIRRLWPDRFVEESNLTFNIKMLRKALGDDATKPCFIETVPKRGYRFIAEVSRSATVGEQENSPGFVSASNVSAISSPPRAVDAGTPRHGAVVALADWRSANEASSPEREPQIETAISDSEDADISPPARNRLAHRLLILLGSAAAILGIGYYFLSAGRPTASLPGKRTIAVLPLRPIDPTTSDPIFEIGIADALINKFNSMNGIIARPLSSIRKYAELTQDSLAAGKEQQVDFVLSSSYHLSENKIRVTWQLLNVATGQIEDNQTAETKTGDVFSMHDAISAEIGRKLAERFSTTINLADTKRGTTNEDAYRLYLQGMYLYDRRTLVDAENALDKLERATQLDANYAKAWAGKAHVHRSLGYFSINRSTHEEYSKSIDAINRALTLDENLSDAHSALCENKFFYEYDFEGAERECKRAVELDPNSFIAHEIYSRCLWTLNRFDEAIKEVKIAIDLQPTSLFSQRNYGISLFYARRGSEAVQQFKRVSEVDPNFVANYAWFVPALLVQGQEAEAFEWFIKWQKLLKAVETTIQAYEKGYQEAGWQGIGRVRVIHFDKAKVRSYFLEAALTAHTSDKDKAFEYLEKSLQRREWGIPFLRIDPSLDAIRSDPRFEDLVHRVRMKPGGQPVFE